MARATSASIAGARAVARRIYFAELGPGGLQAALFVFPRSTLGGVSSSFNVPRYPRRVTIGEVIHRDPEIMSGELVFVGTRVPVYTLFDFLEAGDSLDQFLDEFPSVTREQAIAALKIAREALTGNAHSDR